MNLKLVVASMSVLGLVSCPVLAVAKAKHKHHHKQQMVEHHDYKDMGALPYKDQPVCTISQNTVVMTDMTQNMGRSLPNPCNPGWFNRVSVSGGINVDLGKFGNRSPVYMGENYQRFSLNDAYLNVAADVNEWAKAFASLSYNTATITAPAAGLTVPSTVTGNFSTEYSSAYSNNVSSGGNSTVQLEQAFATFGNMDESPIFVQVGKHFQDFSRYEIHPITRDLTQVMSETLATSVGVGFLSNGFHGQIYGFDDPIAKVGKTAKTTNYGVSLGYDQPSDCLGWGIGAAYLYNIIGVNDIAYSVNQNNALSLSGAGYNTRIGGAAAYADLNSGPFTIGARYTGAVSRFNVNDLQKNGIADLVLAGPAAGNSLSPTGSNQGAKPWSAGVKVGYGFDAWTKNSNVYVGYEASRQSAGLFIPKSRWLVGLGADVFGKNTNVGIEWDHDQAYSIGNGGSGNNSNLVSLRSSVKFG